jgi:hypothetical protein
MTPQEQQLITELFARLKQTPAQAGPNPTLTLLANSSAGAASAAEGATYGFDGRGSTSQETTRTTLIATAISVGFGPSYVPRLCPACCPPLRCTTRFGLSRTLWRARRGHCSRSGLPPR